MPLKSKSKAKALDKQTQQSGNQAVDAPQAPCPLQQDPILLVKVTCDTGGRKFIHARVDAAGPHTTDGRTGIADIGTVAPGTYTIGVVDILAPDDADYVVKAGATKTVVLAKGDRQVVELSVDKKNIVTPKLELEYKVALLDRGLANMQALSDAERFVPGLCRVELSISETNEDYPYTSGAKFTCTPANVDVYLDDKGTLPLVGDLTNAQLPVGTTLKLYLKGKTVGKFSARLALIDPELPGIRIDKPVQEAMGVVELELQVHQHDLAKISRLGVSPSIAPGAAFYKHLKSIKLPDQILMSDPDKVSKGRLLHAQEARCFSRARLLVKKYVKDHWPAGTDNYELVLTPSAISGGLELHGDERDDKLLSTVRIKVRDLKKKDHEFWVQGTEATARPLDARLDLGLDRPDGGLAKTIKRNGDWSRYTVVKIKEVEVDYTTPASGASAWDAAKRRFYINLLRDPAGRKVTIGAQLSTKIANVVIHFMLAPDQNNMKKANWGEDLPGSWQWNGIAATLKHTDKATPTDYLHLSATTDANGYARVELTLSRFGGDKFHPAAYVEQDPHLAKYVHGQTKKRKPTLARAGEVTVWRKFWYQISRPQGLAHPAPAASVAAYERVFTETVLDGEKEFTAAAVPPRTFYPEYMLNIGSSSTALVANIGSYNKLAVSALLDVKPDQPVKRHLMVCRYQCDPGKIGTGRSEPIESDMGGQWIDVMVGSNFVVEPAMLGGSMIIDLHWKRKSDAVQHPIPSADARIPNPRTAPGHIQVKFPLGILPAPTDQDPVSIVAQCHAAESYLGESFGVKHTLAVYDPQEEADFFDTITHEFGHSFNQTPRGGRQPMGVPVHPKQADKGQGNHCQVNTGTALLSGETKYTCVMYDSGPMKWGLHRFCAKCHPYLLVENFHRP